jgi:hypothetical protein
MLSLEARLRDEAAPVTASYVPAEQLAHAMLESARFDEDALLRAKKVSCASIVGLLCLYSRSLLPLW